MGSGLIAQNLLQLKNKPNNALIIAMGVSNSSETEKSSFDRELSLVRNINTNDKVVYFSTCSIYDPLLVDNQYVKHKLKVEEMLIDKFNDLLIIRLPQLLGYGGNPNNLVNYLYFSIKNNKKFTIWSETERNILDINIIKDMIPIMISERSLHSYKLPEH